MITKYLGWVPMDIPVSLDNVNNPRPIIKEAFENNKVSIIHWIDRYRKAVCGKARWYTSILDQNNASTACENIDDEALRPRWVSLGITCPECYKIWSNDKDSGKLHYQEIAKQQQEWEKPNLESEAEKQ